MAMPFTHPSTLHAFLTLTFAPQCQQIQHVLAAGFLAASLTLAPMVAAPLPSKAEGKASIAEAAYEQEALIKEQKVGDGCTA